MSEISDMKPGSVKGIHFVVADIAEARDALVGRGIDVGRSWISAACSTRNSEIPMATCGCGSNSRRSGRVSPSFPA
jgi:hypothetical protein